MLYKKDFKAIATIVKEAKEDHRGGTPIELILSSIDNQLANYFETQNPKFDRGRFLTVCDIGG